MRGERRAREGEQEGRARGESERGSEGDYERSEAWRNLRTLSYLLN